MNLLNPEKHPRAYSSRLLGHPVVINIMNLLNEIKTSSTLFKQLLDRPIIIILIFAAILRFWGIWHGYPFSYYPDEQHFVNRAVSFGSGDLNPHWFHKPAFLMYLLFFEYGLYFVIGKIAGIFSNSDAFAISYFQSSWPFILIGRITVSLFSIATIYVVYKIGEKFWSKKVGLFSSLFLTLCYGHIFSGQDVKADVPTTFFTVLSIYYLLSVVNNNFTKKDYILAGLFAGLGTVTKYYSIVLLLCILIVSIYEIINKRNILLIKKYLYSFIFFWGIYFIVSPYNFLDSLGRRWTFNSILHLFNKLSPFRLNLYHKLDGSENFLSESYNGHYIFNSFINYLKVLFSTEAVGIVIGLIFIFSLFCILLYKPTFKRILLLSFPILFSIVAIVMNPSYTEPRHQLIIYPFLSVVAGITMCEISRKLKNDLKLNIIISVLLIIPLVSIIKNNIYISKPDTRTIAKDWIESHIPANTKILLDEYSPALKMNKINLKEYYEKSKMLKPGQFTMHLEK